MNINIEITEKELRELVVAEIHKRLGDVNFTAKDVKIEVKTKQNYKAEWEEGSFRAKLDVNL